MMADSTPITPASNSSESADPIFISYARKSSLADSANHLYDTLSQERSVFFDKSLPGGTEWEERLSVEIHRARTIVAFVDPEESPPPWQKTEILTALDRAGKNKDIRIIPVVSAQPSESPPSTAVQNLLRYQAIEWGPWSNPNTAIEKIRQALSASQDTTAAPDLSDHDFSPQMISEAEHLFVAPVAFDSMRNVFEQHDIVLIEGAEGSGRKFLARRFVARSDATFKYELAPNQGLDQLSRFLPQDAAVAVPDVLLARSFGEEEGETWHDKFSKLFDRASKIVLTGTAEHIATLRAWLREIGIDNKNIGQITLSESSYGVDQRRAIFRKHIELFDSRLSVQQRKLATRLLDKAKKNNLNEDRDRFDYLLREGWKLVDLRRFVRQTLATLSSEEELLYAIRSKHAYEAHVHRWFLDLDEASRIFLLTFSALGEVSTNTLWDHYKTVVNHLREFLPALPLIPLGLAREQCHPYIESEGQLRFSDSEVAALICTTLASHYREYITELQKFFASWALLDFQSKSPNREEVELERDRQRPTRDALEQLFSAISRTGIKDITPTLSKWASHPRIFVRVLSSRILVQSFIRPETQDDVRDLLKQWTNPEVWNHASVWQRWTAADTANRIVRQSESVPPFAVSILNQLASDSVDRVRGLVAKGLDALASRGFNRQLEQLLAKVALDSKYWIESASALVVVDSKSPKTATKWTEGWENATEDYGRSLVFFKFASANESNEERISIAQKYPASILEILEQLSLRSLRYSNRFLRNLQRLADPSENPNFYPELFEILQLGSQEKNISLLRSAESLHNYVEISALLVEVLTSHLSRSISENSIVQELDSLYAKCPTMHEVLSQIVYGLLGNLEPALIKALTFSSYGNGEALHRLFTYWKNTEHLALHNVARVTMRNRLLSVLHYQIDIGEDILDLFKHSPQLRPDFETALHELLEAGDVDLLPTFLGAYARLKSNFNPIFNSWSNSPYELLRLLPEAIHQSYIQQLIEKGDVSTIAYELKQSKLRPMTLHHLNQAAVQGSPAQKKLQRNLLWTNTARERANAKDILYQFNGPEYTNLEAIRKSILQSQLQWLGVAALMIILVWLIL